MKAVRLLAVLSFGVVPAAAIAHPHVWVDAASEVIFSGAEITAIRHHWRFDEAFSAFAVTGLDTNGDGAMSAEELAPLAKVNVESLSEYGFFTSLRQGSYEAGFGEPTDYWLEPTGERLILHFTLPLARPLKISGEAQLEVFDPEYFVAFALPGENAVRLDEAPPSCTLSVHAAKKPDASAAAMLAAIGADQRELPPELKSLTEDLDNTALIACP